MRGRTPVDAVRVELSEAFSVGLDLQLCLCALTDAPGPDARVKAAFGPGYAK
ncbi:MAG: hypothetical protein WCJ67_00535 [Thermoleophilia bacterium]